MRDKVMKDNIGKKEVEDEMVMGKSLKIKL